MTLEERNQKVVENLGLVRKAASRYSTLSILEYDDLYQEGCIGLIRAVEKYNPDLGYTFSTYAMFWIRLKMLCLLYSNPNLIKIPNYLGKELRKLKELEEKLEKGIRLNKKEKNRFNELYDKGIMKYRYKISSLNAHCYNREVQDYMPDLNQNFDDVTDNVDLDRCIDLLNERERNILISRRGLRGKKERSLKYLAKEYNLTKQRIQQIEKGAIEKLKELMNEKDYKV